MSYFSSATRRTFRPAAFTCEQRTLKLSNQHSQPVTVKIEVDPLGTGKRVPHQRVTVPPGEACATVMFDPLLLAHWLRVTANVNCTATASLIYR